MARRNFGALVPLAVEVGLDEAEVRAAIDRLFQFTMPLIVVCKGLEVPPYLVTTAGVRDGFDQGHAGAGIAVHRDVELQGAPAVKRRAGRLGWRIGRRIIGLERVIDLRFSEEPIYGEAELGDMLETTYGVAADRLTTKGFGATKPVAPNDTVEGRQNNRRVELVKG